MQADRTQPKRRNGRGAGTVLLSLLLALVLGGGGYFGVTMLLTGQNPLGGGSAVGDDFIPASDLPTDSSGNNLIGNSMQNLYAGGLIAMQGEDLFYANPADGGSLYCRARNGETTKLTDFAVANLNVSGERLVFTDLDACSLVGENGETTMLSAATHDELWEQAGESDHIRYGGRLYFIMGIKSFCAGELNYDELTIAGLDSAERYLAPVLMESGDILLVAASPGSGVTPASASLDLAAAIKPLSAGGGLSVRPVKASGAAFTPDSVMTLGAGGAMNRINLNTSKGDLIQNAVAAGGMAFAETYNIANPSRMGLITMLDPATGKALGTLSGHSMQSDGTNMYFINDDTIFKFSPETGNITQVSHTPCDSHRYEIRPDGTVGYESKDPETGEMVPMRATPENNGYAPSVDRSKWKFELDKRSAFWLGNSCYGWNTSLKCWTRIDYEWLAKNADGGTDLNDRAIVPMPWGVEQRDKGQNAMLWLPPDELGGLFSHSDRPNDPSAPASETPEPAPDTPEPAPDPEPETPEPEPETPDAAPEAPAQPSGGGGLSGLYVSEDNSRHTLDFHSDGTVDLFYAGVSITFDYTVSGSTVTFIPPANLTGAYAGVADFYKDVVIDGNGNISIKEGYETYIKQ